MITINTRVGLEFLGEEYAESYLTFKAISIKEIDEIQKQIEKSQEDDQASRAFLQNIVQERFVSGVIKQDGKDQEVTKDDLLDFPITVLATCIERMIGKTDPKS